MDIQGKAAVVTGGGNGIGQAICLELAKAGCKLIAADIELEAAEATASQCRALGAEAAAVRVDVTSEASLHECADQAWERFGSVEILVNNAGVLHDTKPLVDTSAEEFAWLFGVNVGGVLNGIRVFGQRFIESDAPAWIVNTGSEHSLGIPHLYGGIYTATKHAVLGLSDVLSRELPEHVGVSVLCPGLVQSTLWKSVERRSNDFGGAAEANAGGAAFMAEGLAAETVAEKVVEGIREEQFYILTHPHVVEYARERWESISQAFSTQAPRFDGDEAYSVAAVTKKLFS